MAAVLIALAGCGGVVAGEVEGGAADAAPAANSDDESVDGITVHGHWRLDVMNADGTLDQTVEFENGLRAMGRLTLRDLIVGDASAGRWGILLDGEIGDEPCTAETFDSAPLEEDAACFVMEPDVDVTNLEGGFDAPLALSAAVSIENPSTITRVATLLAICPATVAPSSCDARSYPFAQYPSLPFTLKLASDDPADNFEPIPVDAGQIVQVTVEIDFDYS